VELSDRLRGDFFGETDMCQGFGVWMLGAQEREQEQSEEFTTSTSFCSVTASSPDSPHLFHCFQKLPLLDDPRRPFPFPPFLSLLSALSLSIRESGSSPSPP